VLIPALLLVPLAARPALPAEVYFEQTTLVRSRGGAGAPGVLSRVWYAGQRMRLEPGEAQGGPALVLRLDRGKAYRIDPEHKRAVELDLERMRARAQMDLALAGELMGGAETVRTTELPAGKVLAGYSCRGYRIAAGGVSMDLYVSEAVPLGVDSFADFLEWSGASRSLGGLLGEIRHLPGFPLQTRSKVEVMGDVQETLSTVTKVSLGPFAAGLFEPPPGYRLEPEERLEVR